MKEDKLDKFLRENREQFDVYDPDPGIWQKIKPVRPVREEKPVNWRIILWRAAAVGIIFILSYLVSEYVFKRYGPLFKFSISNRKEIRIPELQEAEIYYTSQLQVKFQEVKDYLTDHPGLEGELIRDFTALDSIHHELKKDLKDNVSNKEVVEALILNYRIKLTILEDLLQHLEYAEGVEHNENNKHEL